MSFQDSDKRERYCTPIIYMKYIIWILNNIESACERRAPFDVFQKYYHVMLNYQAVSVKINITQDVVNRVS